MVTPRTVRAEGTKRVQPAVQAQGTQAEQDGAPALGGGVENEEVQLPTIWGTAYHGGGSGLQSRATGKAPGTFRGFASVVS